MPDYPNVRDCEHGQLRRSCNICEYEQRISKLEQFNTGLAQESHEQQARIAELEAHIERLRCLLMTSSDLVAEGMEKQRQYDFHARGACSTNSCFAALKQTPAHSLHSVRAQAVREFAGWVCENSNIPVDHLDMDQVADAWVEEHGK